MIVSPEDTYEADVLIEDGVIECIGKNLEAKFGDADKVIDAKGNMFFREVLMFIRIWILMSESREQ